jgi:UDP-N-acetylmuramoylalanine-D-glutamate ligase
LIADRRSDDRRTGRSFARSFVLSPGVPLTHPAAALDGRQGAKAAGVEIIGDIELFFRERAKSRAWRLSSASPAPTASRRRRR